jgi:hypothetical protein
MRVAAYQFRDRNAHCLLSRAIMETRAFRVVGSGSAMKSIGGSNCPVECLIRSSNTWIAEDERAKFGWVTIARARGFRVQGRQPNGKIDRQVRQ